MLNDKTHERNIRQGQELTRCTIKRYSLISAIAIYFLKKYFRLFLLTLSSHFNIIVSYENKIKKD